jgi:hypothetical protein
MPGKVNSSGMFDDKPGIFIEPFLFKNIGIVLDLLKQKKNIYYSITTN